MTIIACKVLQPLSPGYLVELRRWARAWMLSRRSRVDAQDVVLGMTELVGDSAEHGGGPIEVEISDDGELLLLQVSDRSDGVPGQPQQDTTAEGGRGVLLMDRLALRWGVRLRQGGGKTVWCEFAPVR